MLAGTGEYCICINLGIKSQHCCWRENTVFLVPSPSPAQPSQAPAQPSPEPELYNFSVFFARRLSPDSDCSRVPGAALGRSLFKPSGEVIFCNFE